jgi:hypothetical protein
MTRRRSANVDWPKEIAMKLALVALVFFVGVSQAVAGDDTKSAYEGTWHTTNRKLDGTMTCAVTDLGGEKWQGRFYGVWQGVAFDYVVTFTGPRSALRGKAQIDGADYTWTGDLTSTAFKGTFGGNRYAGSFDLARKPARTALQR